VPLAFTATTVEEVLAWSMFRRHVIIYPYYYYYYYPYYAYYYPQYALTVSTNPQGLSSAVSGGGSYSYGSTATFTASEVVKGEDGVRYIFTGWSGDYNGASPTGSIRIDSSKSITANYKTQYYLRVVVNPSGLVSVAGEGWYDAGTRAEVGGAPSPIGDGGTRHVFIGWTVDGSQTQGNPISVVMDKSHTAVATYKKQFYLKVNSPITVVQGEGWYDAGSVATVAAQGAVPAGGVIGALGGKLVFDGWGGDASGTSPTLTITMDRPHVVVASWAADYTMVYLVAILLSGVTFLGGVFASKALTGIPRVRLPRIPLRIRRGTPEHRTAKRVKTVEGHPAPS